MKKTKVAGKGLTRMFEINYDLSSRHVTSQTECAHFSFLGTECLSNE